MKHRACQCETNVRRRPAASGGSTRRARLLLILLLLTSLTHAVTQQRFNFLAVEDSLLDDAGPYYFIDFGDARNAYAKAGPLAAAMGLTVTYDGEGGRLLFTRGDTRVAWRITRDVADGLQHREATLKIDGNPFQRAVPSALLIDGTSYVAVTPLAEAFGGNATWLPSARVIRVTLPTTTMAVAGTQRPGGDTDITPRIGRHDGYTRVALDAPNGQATRILTSDDTVALVLTGLPLAPLDRTLDVGPLTRVYTDTLDGEPALVLLTSHTIDATGRGYRLGRTATGTIYIDVGPDLQGEPAAGTAPERSEPVRPPSSEPPSDDASAAAAEAAPPTPRRYVVVLDAGHGGHDPGTVSDWAQEKEIVLDVALRVAEHLRAAGIDVILTRDDDTFLTLQERSTYATTERNIFVSIHANAAPNENASGIETWVFGQPLDPSLIDRAIRENGGGEVGAALTAEAAEVADIAGDILRETQLNYSLTLANLIQDAMVGATGATDRGVRQNLFYVIRNSRIPAVLLELGFVSHADEGRKLMQDGYRDTLAEAIGDGLLTFLAAGGDDADLAAR